MHARVDEVRAKVTGTATDAKDKVADAASSAKDGAAEATPSSVASGAQSAAHSAAETAKARPIPTTAIAAFAAGLVVGRIVWSRR